MGRTRQRWLNILQEKKVTLEDANFFKMYLDFSYFAL